MKYTVPSFGNFNSVEEEPQISAFLTFKRCLQTTLEKQTVFCYFSKHYMYCWKKPKNQQESLFMLTTHRKRK